jgi:transposase
MARPIKRLHGEPDVVKELRRRSLSTTIGVRDRERANIILLRLDGVGVEAVAERLKTTPKRVSLWSRRFETSGLEGLDDKPGRGRKPSIPNAKVARVVTEATRPPKSKTRWSIRSMSRRAGISASSVGRIWLKSDLKPHRVKTFKLSNDPKFEEKFWDVVGLYLDPPAKALVLCCDEKSQSQGLERTQLGLPLAPKRPRTMTHDYRPVRLGRVCQPRRLSDHTAPGRPVGSRTSSVTGRQ